MTEGTSKCNCELASCKYGCSYNHTHKEFWCEKCHPERYKCSVCGIDASIDHTHHSQEISKEALKTIKDY